MKSFEAMNWQTFKNLLLQYPDKHLQFRYAQNKLVNASYHITEVKQSPVVSVDCGGKMNSWTEIIIQLWEPAVKDSERSMKVSKVLSIVELVEKTLLLNPLATIKIEFGNSEFDTRQMYPNEFIADKETLTVDLRPDFTQCKAIGRGQSCGTTASDEECCTTDNAIQKPEIKLKNISVTSCCEPDSGCC